MISRMSKMDAYATLCSFLSWAEADDPHMMYGNYKVDRALEALSAVAGISIDSIKEIAGTKKGDKP